MLKALLRPFSDLPDVVHLILWSFQRAPDPTGKVLDGLEQRYRGVKAGLVEEPTLERFNKELDVLDSKANALQQLNAIGVAIVVFVQMDDVHSIRFRVAIFVALLFLAWSVLTVAPLNLVSWGHRRSQKPADNTPRMSPTVEEGTRHLRLLRLLRLSDMRSNLLRRATVRSVAAFFLLTVLVAVSVFIGRYA